MRNQQVTNSVDTKSLLTPWQRNETPADTQQARLTQLIEWCKIVQRSLDDGQIQDARIFLAVAINEAQKPLSLD